MRRMQWRRVGAVVGVGLLLSALTASGQVVINEIAWAGTAASSSDEWIELHNAGSEVVDLAGWTLQVGESLIRLGEAADATVEVRRSTIEPGGYFLRERTDDSTVSDVEADVIYRGSLSNGGADIVLVNALGETVDQTLSGEDGWPGGTAGDADEPYSTMERVVTSSGGDAWFSCMPAFGACGLDADGGALAGTPKAENSLVGYFAPAPQLDLISPAGDMVRGTILIQWTAVDPDGDDSRLRIRISLWQDDESVLLGENLANSGSFAWDTTAHADGTYGLLVTAEDPLGNTDLGGVHIIEIQNGS